MSNIIQVKRGSGKPDQKLAPYELGIDISDSQLYFGGAISNNSYGDAQEVKVAKAIRALGAEKIIGNDGSGVTLGSLTTPIFLQNGQFQICGGSSISGTIEKAEMLATSRQIGVNLSLDSFSSFNGQQDIETGVTGVLPISKGGTGKTSVLEARQAITYAGNTNGTMFYLGRDKALISCGSSEYQDGIFFPLTASKTQLGSWSIGSTGFDEKLYFVYTPDSSYASITNNNLKMFTINPTPTSNDQGIVINAKVASAYQADNSTNSTNATQADKINYKMLAADNTNGGTNIANIIYEYKNAIILANTKICFGIVTLGTDTTNVVFPHNIHYSDTTNLTITLTPKTNTGGSVSGKITAVTTNGFAATNNQSNIDYYWIAIGK